MTRASFEWNDRKDLENQAKHGVSFYEAQFAFLDERRLIAEDPAHTLYESRYFCLGLDREGAGVLTVRFTWRDGIIRIIGAGSWRKGRKLYEEANPLP